MIHYSCDVCGKPMPDGYQRTVRPPRAGSEGLLLSATKVSDVCPSCLIIGARLSVQDTLLGEWRRAVDAAEREADSPEEPPTPPLLREHDVSQAEPKPCRIDPNFVDKAGIRDRLVAYRARNGLGSLGPVARAARRKTVTTDILREILVGGVTLPASDWKAIERALDKLAPASTESEEGSDGEDA